MAGPSGKQFGVDRKMRHTQRQWVNVIKGNLTSWPNMSSNLSNS